MRLTLRCSATDKMEPILCEFDTQENKRDFEMTIKVWLESAGFSVRDFFQYLPAYCSPSGDGLSGHSEVFRLPDLVRGALQTTLASGSLQPLWNALLPFWQQPDACDFYEVLTELHASISDRNDQLGDEKIRGLAAAHLLVFDKVKKGNPHLTEFQVNTEMQRLFRIGRHRKLNQPDKSVKPPACEVLPRLAALMNDTKVAARYTPAEIPADVAGGVIYAAAAAESILQKLKLKLKLTSCAGPPPQPASWQVKGWQQVAGQAAAPLVQQTVQEVASILASTPAGAAATIVTALEGTGADTLSIVAGPLFGTVISAVRAGARALSKKASG